MMQQSQAKKSRNAFRVAKTPAPPRPVDAEAHVDASTWIDFNSSSSGVSRKDVRAQAARASAAARRATLAKKQARRGTQPGSLIFALPAPPVVNKRALFEAVKHVGSKDDRKATSAERDYFEQMIPIVTQLLDRKPLTTEQLGETSLAHSSIRSMLWDAMTISTTLFQVAIFIAGTHANTCGLPRSAFVHMGPGLVALRGGSLDAIQAQVTSSDAESIAPVAVALLAGWERRYGDPDSYDVHMKAWKTLSFPGHPLEENNVSTLTDLTLEMYRMSLNSQSATMQADGSRLKVKYPGGLPEGFRIFDNMRAEVKSLLALTAQLAQYDPASKTELARLRRHGLENMAWSPTHTRGVAPAPGE
jgi:hypothetical protein